MEPLEIVVLDSLEPWNATARNKALQALSGAPVVAREGGGRSTASELVKPRRLELGEVRCMLDQIRHANPYQEMDAKVNRQAERSNAPEDDGGEGGHWKSTAATDPESCLSPIRRRDAARGSLPGTPPKV